LDQELIATHSLFLLGDVLQKAYSSVVSNRIGMKFDSTAL